MMQTILVLKCGKCKQGFGELSHSMPIGSNKMVKKMVCKACFDKKQKWLAQRGLPLNK